VFTIDHRLEFSSSSSIFFEFFLKIVFILGALEEVFEEVVDSCWRT
jgi:hypothetical protein